MASNHSPQRNRMSRFGADIPRIELIRISQRGAVLRCNRAYETGDSLALGLQVSQAFDSGCGSGQSFLDLEGMVIQCRRLRLQNAEMPYEITLMFGELSDDETHLLEDACQSSAPASFPWPSKPWSLN